MATQVRNRNEFTPPRRTGRTNGTPADTRGSVERRKTVLALLIMAVAILVFLALVSYDADDERKVKLFLDSPSTILSGGGTAADRPDTPNNWLAAVGAIVAFYLVKSTFGYVTVALPVLILLWGWTMLRKQSYGRVITITNYTIVAALLISASFGMIRLIFPDGGPSTEWSGEDGYWLALKLSQIVGRAGGSIVLFVSILITAVLAVDLDVHQTVERLRTLALQFADWMGRTMGSWQERRQAAREEKEADATQKQVRPRPADENEPGEEVEPLRETVRPAPTINRTEVRKPSPVLLVKPAPELPPGAKEHAGELSPSGDIAYVPPSVDLLTPPAPGKEDVDEEELKANADLLRETLAEFDVELESVSVTPGPVVTLYELVPASGVKISRIVSLENDMALKLAAKGIRIMAPIPGKSAVGVEIPNSHRSLVTIKSVIDTDQFRDASANLPLAMGKTISGEVFTDDLGKMPHLLIAGSTGSGKSVGINTILASLLFRLHPSDLKLVIIDPKKIELAQYGKLKNHFLAVSPDVDEEIITTPRNAVMALKGVEYEMEQRYDKLAAAGVRNIVDYNDKVKHGKLKDTEEVKHAKMPYLIVVIDELADLMITAAREVEEPIARLAQLARAVGIHLIVATQRPSVDVITGVIKANFPARIAYQVASKTDSRTILDMNGAEQLLGNGDMLYLASGTPKPIRLQNAYISPDEVDAIVDHIAAQAGFAAPFTLPSIMEKKRSADGAGGEGRDELFEEAARLIVRHQQGSVSLLQRRLKVGYSRAARLVDELEAAGIVGPFDGSKAREVLVESEAELDVILNS